MSALGQRVRPDQWDERTSGSATYTTDIALPGMLEARILRSPHPHADIRSIDTSRAEAHTGVAAVITAEDLPDRTYLHLGEPFSDRLALAWNRVRFVGEEVAAVAARTQADADEALDLIEVDYQERDSVLTTSHARRDGDVATVHDDAVGNLALQAVRSYGDLDRARSEAEAAVSGTYVYAPAAHVCLERHSTVARWDPVRQRLDLWVSTQAPYFVRKEVAHMLDLRPEQIRTHPVAVGGGFGAKAKAGCHEVIAAALAMRTKRPVRLVLDRDEEFATTAVRHAFQVELTTGARSDGTLTHRDGYVTVDNGAYNHAGPSVAIYATMLAAGPYRLGGCETAVSLVYTNKQPGASFRGYGNPQMTFAMESQIDELADRLGIDPIDLRLLNAPESGDVTLTGWRLGSARLAECLQRARDEIGWDAKRTLGGNGRGVGRGCRGARVGRQRLRALRVERGRGGGLWRRHCPGVLRGRRRRHRPGGVATPDRGRRAGRRLRRRVGDHDGQPRRSPGPRGVVVAGNDVERPRHRRRGPECCPGPEGRRGGQVRDEPRPGAAGLR